MPDATRDLPAGYQFGNAGRATRADILWGARHCWQLPDDGAQYEFVPMSTVFCRGFFESVAAPVPNDGASYNFGPACWCNGLPAGVDVAQCPAHPTRTIRRGPVGETN